MLETLGARSLRSAPNSVGSGSPRSPSKSKSDAPSVVLGAPNMVDKEAVDKLLETKRGQTTMRARWLHGKSVSSAYWDPRGRSIVSTSYDDTIRSESMFAVHNLKRHSLILDDAVSMGHAAFMVRQGRTISIFATIQPDQAQLPNSMLSSMHQPLIYL